MYSNHRQCGLTVGVERELYTVNLDFPAFFKLFLPMICCISTFLRVQAGVCDCVCVLVSVREWCSSSGPERRSHGSLIPPTLKVKASTLRSRRGEVETDR